MKMHLFLLNQVVAALVITAGLASPLRVNAQQNPPLASPKRTKAPTERTLPRYNLEIVNGQLLLDNLKDRIDLTAKFGRGSISTIDATLNTVVNILRELHTNANIVMEPSLAKIKITDLKIRSIQDSDEFQLKEELLALSVASGYKFRWEQPGGPSAIDPLTGQPLSYAIDPLTGLPLRKENSSSLYVLSPDLATTAPASRRTVEVFSMAGYLQQQEPKEINSKLDQITMIIKSAVRQLKRDEFTPEDEVTFEFHPGANLLIVVGPQDSIDVAQKVMNALPGQTRVESRTRNVLVMGGVSKPGSVALPEDRKLTIIDAIGLAGGTTKLANLRKIEFTHNGKTEIFSFDNLKKMTDQSQIIYLEPGDIIKVHETIL